MKCLCNSQSFYKGNGATLFEQEFLREIKVDAIEWKTLYQCKQCKIYWEEHNQEERFVSVPVLQKVSNSHVESNWNI